MCAMLCPMMSSVVSAEARSPQIWTPTGTLVATGSIRMGGLEGEWRMAVDLANGRFDTSADLGAYRIADIYDGHTRWRVEPSGGHHSLDSDFARAMTRSDAWLARFGWLQGGYGGAVFSATVNRDQGGTTYLVRTATPRGGRPVVLWFDAVTGDVTKTERRGWFATVTTRYSDYRVAMGQRLPFAIAVADADGEQTIKIARYAIESGPVRFAPPSQPDDASIPADGTTVPAAIFPQLVIEASINRSEPMGFVFDTGGHSILTPAAAHALGLKVAGESQTGGSGAGTITQRDTAVKMLQIGDAVLHNQHFFVLSLGYSSVEQGAKPPLVGLLGLEILERFIVRVNYRAATLTLLPHDKPVDCRGSWQRVRFTDDMPTVDAALDGIPGAFTIDTGNNGALQLYDHWERQHGMARQFRQGVETLTYGAGGASHSWVSYGRSFRIGGVTIPRPMIRTSDDRGGVALSITEAGNLGTALLANYTLTFDYARSRVCFDYVPGYVPVPFNRAGLRAIKTDQEFFTISLVNVGSPAALAGLKKDDHIVVVDGQSARVLGGGDLTRIFTQPAGTRVVIDYVRDGEMHRSDVVLREMLR
jgi:hypothetical protein